MTTTTTEEEGKDNDTFMVTTEDSKDDTNSKDDSVKETEPKEPPAASNEEELKNDTPSDITKSNNDANTMPPPKDKETVPDDSNTTDKDVEMKDSEKKTAGEEKEEKKQEGETADAPTDTAAAAAKLPPRPIKKARTAYFIFADEKRAEITARHPGEGVGAVARETGQLWSALTEEEKAPYHQQSAEEKQVVAKLLEQYKDALPADSALTASPQKPSAITSLQLPSARIRKIAKLDPQVKGMSKEALLLVTKSAELFTSKLGMETVKVAALQNRRKLLPQDLAHVCSAREQFLFLKEDLRDLQQSQSVQNAAIKAKKKSETSSSAAGTNGKPLTDYFASKSSSSNTVSN